MAPEAFFQSAAAFASVTDLIECYLRAAQKSSGIERVSITERAQLTAFLWRLCCRRKTDELPPDPRRRLFLNARLLFILYLHYVICLSAQ